MSATAAEDKETRRQEDKEKDGTASPSLLVWPAAVVLAVSFFVSWHDFHESQQIAETDEPEVTPEETTNQGDQSRQLAFAAVGVLGLCYLVRPGGNPFHPRGLLPLALLGYLAWCAGSFCWSIDQALTLRRLAILAFLFLAALGLGRQLSARDLCVLALGVTTVYLGLGLAAELVLGTFHPLSSEYQFSGTMHPNQQGTHCALLALAAFCLAGHEGKDRRLEWALFAVGIGFLVLTKSRTSCAAFLITLLIVVSLRVSFRTRIAVALGAVWAISGLLLAASLFDLGNVAETVLLGRTENASSLTGRLPLWKELVTTYLPGHLLLGHGYGAFWTPHHLGVLARLFDWDIPDAHSVYLETLLNVGLIGGGLLALTVLGGIRQALAHCREPGQSGPLFLFALLVYGCIDGLTEAGFVLPTFYALLAGCGLVRLAFFPSAPQGQLP